MYGLRAPLKQCTYPALAEAEEGVRIALPTGPHATSARVRVPAHLLDVTLLAVEPPMPAATADDDTGYFYRVRNRTQRVYHFATAASSQPAASITEEAENLQVAEEPTIEFEYHPRPSLSITMKGSSGNGNSAADANSPPLQRLGCAQAEAIDGRLALVDGYEPLPLATAPGWQTSAGSRVRVEIAITERLPGRSGGGPAEATLAQKEDDSGVRVCDWVEHASQPNGVLVTHRSQLGLSDHDVEIVKEGSESARFAAFQQDIQDSFGEHAVNFTELGRCRRAGDAECSNFVRHDVQHSYTDLFGSDHTCTTPESAAAIARPANYEPVRAAGPRPSSQQFPSSAVPTDASPWYLPSDECTAQWRKLGEHPRSQYRAWHQLPFDSLRETEKALWRDLGLEEPYIHGTGSDWQHFTRSVLVAAAPPWKYLLPSQKNAAHGLYFTASTWGRGWAFLARIHHDDAHLISWGPDHLVPAEADALRVLGWDSHAWNDPDAAKPASASLAWAALTRQQQNATVQVLRISPEQWDEGLSAAKLQPGCFWHRGQFAATGAMHVYDAATEGLAGTGTAATTTTEPSMDELSTTAHLSISNSVATTAKMETSVSQPTATTNDNTTTTTTTTTAITVNATTTTSATETATTATTTTSTAVTPQTARPTTTHSVGAKGGQPQQQPTCSRLSYMCISAELGQDDDIPGDGPLTNLTAMHQRCSQSCCEENACTGYELSSSPQCAFLRADQMQPGSSTPPMKMGTTTTALDFGSGSEASSGAGGSQYHLRCLKNTHRTRLRRAESADLMSSMDLLTSTTTTTTATEESTELMPSQDVLTSTTTITTAAASAESTDAMLLLDALLSTTTTTTSTSTSTSNTATATIAMPSTDPLAKRSTTRRPAAGATVSMCTAGYETDVHGCRACPTGRFRSVEMTMYRPTCVSKRTYCQEGTYLARTSNFGAAESTTADDTMCVPEGLCPSGNYRSHSQQCIVCPAGSFIRTVSNARACVTKHKHSCGAGSYILVGESKIEDDNVCVGCPAGTFQPAESSVYDPERGRTCRPKSRRVSCPAGQYYSTGTSTTEDDSLCARCPSGMYTNTYTLLGACAAKTIASCPMGHYHVAGHSATEDDWECLSCPPGTFQPAHSVSTTCLAKASPGVPCAAGRYLHQGDSTISNDNLCIPSGFCAAGFYVATPVSDGGASRCTTCASGQYNPSISKDTACRSKSVEACSAGEYMHLGSSTLSNDVVCATCPAGFFSNATSNGVCVRKRLRVSQCPAGTHVSPYTSVMRDDSACVLCRQGTFAPYTSSSPFCSRKQTPAACDVGTYLHKGTDSRADDWRCQPCAAGRFSDQVSLATQCHPKTTAAHCAKTQVLRVVEDSTQNNICQAVATCEAGSQIHSAADVNRHTCTRCSPGRYNPTASAHGEVCRKKLDIVSCPAGSYLAVGTSVVRNDRRCTLCPSGTYSAATRPPRTSCIPKQGPSTPCPPGAHLIYGHSTTEDDWECRQRPLLVSLCRQTTGARTRSVRRDVAVGLPEVAAPFVRQYVATAKVPGYERVVAQTSVVITGTRRIAGASTEVATLPQGRPLLVIHDPPGSLSFASFTNAEASIKFHHLRQVQTPQQQPNTALNEVGTLIDIKQAQSQVMFDSAAATTSTANSAWKQSREQVSYATATFSYSTSSNAQMAGPSSDSFVVPAVSYELSSVWQVQLATDISNSNTTTTTTTNGSSSSSSSGVVESQSVCHITGREDRHLLARIDAAGFQFVTAQDIEDRILPSLEDVVSDLKFRVACADMTGPCCRVDQDRGIDDVTMGCRAATGNLSEYCDFKHGSDRTVQPWLHCFEIVESRFKAECKAKRGRFCSTSTIHAKNLAEYCQHTVAAASSGTHTDANTGTGAGTTGGQTNQIKQTLAECLAFSDPASIMQAYDDWYHTVQRNYQHHAQAAAQSTSGLPLYLAGSRSNQNSLVPLQDIVPDALTDRLDFPMYQSRAKQTKQMLKQSNTITFSGGVGAVVYTTRRFSQFRSQGTQPTATGETRATTDAWLSPKSQLQLTFIGSSEVVDPPSPYNPEATSVPAIYSDYISHTVDIVEIGQGSAYQFQLEDQDVGDYFVLSVWNDPDYGTPLFSVDGGLSSCQWEVGTGHRTQPTLSWSYVGPTQVSMSTPALFRVALRNSLAVSAAQNNGGRGDLLGWAASSPRADLEFFLVQESRVGGLRVKANGQDLISVVFAGFGTVTQEVLVEVHAGPQLHVYTPPVLGWRELCDADGNGGVQHGEGGAAHTDTNSLTGTSPYALYMPHSNNHMLEFTEPCSSLDLRVAIDSALGSTRTASPTVNGENGTSTLLLRGAITPTVGRGGLVSAPRTLSGITVEYLAVENADVTGRASSAAAWVAASNTALMLSDPEDDYVELGEIWVGQWRGPNAGDEMEQDRTARSVEAVAPRGSPLVVYVRLVGTCYPTSRGDSNGDSGSSTADMLLDRVYSPSIKVTIDTTPPVLHQVTSLAGTETVGPSDVVTALFNEPIRCIPGAVIELGGAKITSTHYWCTGSEVKIRIPSNDGAVAAGLADLLGRLPAGSLAVRFPDGAIEDLVGNQFRMEGVWTLQAGDSVSAHDARDSHAATHTLVASLRDGLREGNSTEKLTAVERKLDDVLHYLSLKKQGQVVHYGGNDSVADDARIGGQNSGSSDSVGTWLPLVNIAVLIVVLVSLLLLWVRVIHRNATAGKATTTDADDDAGSLADGYHSHYEAPGGAGAGAISITTLPQAKRAFSNLAASFDV